METQPAQGWWRASDGRWYPEGAAAPDGVNPPLPQHWWENSVFVVMMLLLCFVPGLILLWLKRQWGIGAKLALTALTLLLFVVGLMLQDDIRAARSDAVRARAAAVADDGRLTRFGALDADWVAYHEQNPYNPATWDLDRRLPGGRSSRYASVVIQGGRVSSLSLVLPEGTSIDQAVAEALTELPADATILWRLDGATCTSVSAESQTLQQAGAAGRVLITLYTLTIYNDGFDPMNVNHAQLVAADIPPPADPESQCPQ